MKKTISNKELIERLKNYYMEQDPEVVAHCLAAAQIDLSRVFNLDDLPEPELLSLQIRLQLHETQLIDFIENGPKGKLKVQKLNSDEL